MRAILSAVLITAVLFTWGCKGPEKKPWVPKVTSQLAILKTELSCIDINDPVSDMKRNVSYGDYRARVVCGEVCLAPGMDNYPMDRLQRLGMLPFEGVSGLSEGTEHQELVKKALAYAEAYNKALIHYLRQRGLD